MNVNGRIIFVAPLIFYAPPWPQKTVTTERVSFFQVVSASQAEYTDTSSPTKIRDNATKGVLAIAFPVRVFTRFDSNDLDTIATFSASHTENPDVFKAIPVKCKKMMSDYSNALLSWDGLISCSRWLPRVILDEVSLHEHRALATNIRRAIQFHNIDDLRHNDQEHDDRLKRMATSKLSFVWHQQSMIQHINRAIVEATQNVITSS